jgi:hypothetical protein
LFKNQDSKLIFHKIFQVLLRFFQKGFKIKKNIFYSTFKKRPENGKIAKTFCFSQTISKKVQTATKNHALLKLFWRLWRLPRPRSNKG